MSALLDAALAYAARGWPVFPCTPGQKVPAGQLVHRGVLDASVDASQIRAWWAAIPDANIGIATGAPGPDVVDIDVHDDGSGWDVLPLLAAERLIDGPGGTVETPSGGLHLYFAGTSQRNGSVRKAHVDFRGAGGYVLAPPSVFSGRPYTQAASYGTRPQAADWRAIRALLDPPPDPQPFTQPGRDKPADGSLRPGDDWAQRTSWAQILAPHGWRRIRDLGSGRAGWCRPDKEGRFISATTRDDGGLYVFSSSTCFETEVPYSKFGAYAVLEHGGDHAAAAAALRAAGYGTPLPAPAVTLTQPQQAAGGQQDAEQPDGDPISSRLLTGDVILDEPALPPAVWGDGENVAWAEGESFILAGPDGVGKTTVAGQLVKARLGIGTGVVLGMRVQPGRARVLYLMMDRPRQIRRALARIFTEADRVALKDRLAIWQGPPPADLARDPGMLLHLCQLAGADTVIVDSLKDAALKLSEDETGSGWNRARQNVTAAGIQILELHHPRKEQSGNKRPAELADLFGSRWISAGAGSVIMLWGKAGAPLIEMIHLKQPASQIGPWHIRADRQAGTVELATRPNLLDAIAASGAEGITADAAAVIRNETSDPSKAEIEAARRALVRLTQQEKIRPLGRRPEVWVLNQGRGNSVETEDRSTGFHASAAEGQHATANRQVSGAETTSTKTSTGFHDDFPATVSTQPGDTEYPGVERPVEAGSKRTNSTTCTRCGERGHDRRNCPLESTP